MQKPVIILILLAASNLLGLEIYKRQNNTFGNVYLHIIEVSEEENIGFRLIDTHLSQKGYYLKDYWDPTKFEFIINGGYFDSNFSPEGLCKVDGNIVSNAQASKLSGYLVFTDEGKIDLLWKEVDPAIYFSIMQSGPYIIDPGTKLGIHGNSRIRAFRTVVGKKEDGGLLFITTSEVSLYNLSRILKEEFPDIERALNLDGGPSTGVICPSVVLENKNKIRNLIVKNKG